MALALAAVVTAPDQDSPLARLEPWASELLAAARVGHLGLLDDHARPRVLPVTFARCGDRLVTAIDAKPKRTGGERIARVRWLRARPDAALTVDVYDDDWSRLAWVQVLGRTVVSAAAEDPEALAALRRKYAPYREEPPAGPIIALLPSRVVRWRAAGA